MNLEKQAETLNDLILINNDRIEGYQKAIDELKPEDSDLRILFRERVEQSMLNRDELAPAVVRGGEKIAEGTMVSGKIYRAWMDVKAFFSGNNRKAILDNCVFGEEAALRAYEEALNSEDLTPEQRAIVIRQQAEIQVSFDEIKAMRDMLG
ncbi:PA2169 family four-helix-bundle protein [Proteiniphilum sp. X52]|uniref:ferritin-like domain-containing protein n=1 Tax=Proteiniphilum sp. X52 TaxID=2382159 RepID=UPI000F0A14D1|nr:PA2169 family four-helix-bundle protein [Proteiniphilum sp. X52]RNC63372.1 PA2169 family four-helix-bundle protein [Proteiniphilum sp. X52]